MYEDFDCANGETIVIYTLFIHNFATTEDRNFKKIVNLSATIVESDETN